MSPTDGAACMTCLDQPGRPHCDWHPTRAELLAIGRDMSRRAKAREHWEVVQMHDPLLDAYLIRLKRMIGDQEWPMELRELLEESLSIAQHEMDWRQRAARRGAPGIIRQQQWRDRVEAVRRETDLAHLIAYECANARPAGLGKWEASCPFHADREPSLSIDVAKGLWHCFGCEAGGDAFTYVMLSRGLDFKAALAHLEDRLGIRQEKVIRGVKVARVGSDS